MNSGTIDFDHREHLSPQVTIPKGCTKTTWEHHTGTHRERTQQVGMMTICWWLMVFFSGGFQHLRVLASILSSSWWLFAHPFAKYAQVKLDHVPPKTSGQTYKIKIKRWKKHHPPSQKSLIKNVPRIPFTDGRFGAWLSMTHWKGKCCCQPPSWTEPDGILPCWKDAVSQHRGRPCLVFALLAASPPKPRPPHSERRGEYLRG